MTDTPLADQVNRLAAQIRELIPAHPEIMDMHQTADLWRIKAFRRNLQLGKTSGTMADLALTEAQRQWREMLAEAAELEEARRAAEETTEAQRLEREDG